VFVVAWIAQFIGHMIEGRKPSFLTDLTYLLIGPPGCSPSCTGLRIRW
jgi:uncharacterized membrane protein YGL010W